MALGWSLYMRIFVGLYCFRLVDADLCSSVRQVFSESNVTDLQPWKVIKNGLHDLKVTYFDDDGKYEAASAFLLRQNGSILGESFILRNKLSQRVVSVNLFPDGSNYVISQDGHCTQEDMRTREVNSFDRPQKSDELSVCSRSDLTLTQRSPLGFAEPHAEVPKGETDDDGNYVIDVLFIFSAAAKAVVEQALHVHLDEYVSLQKLIVEAAWATAGKSGASLRVIGHEIWPRDLAMSREAALWVRDNTFERLKRTGSDLVAYFTNGTETGSSQHRGISGFKDYYSLQLVDDLKAWSRQLVNNAGLTDCPQSKQNFAAKLRAAEKATSPHCICSVDRDLLLSLATSQRVRLNADSTWRHYQAVLSGLRKSRIPPNGVEADCVLMGRMMPGEVNNSIIEWTVSALEDRMIVEVRSAASDESYNLFSVFIDAPGDPQIYEGDDTLSSLHVFVIDCPSLGPWKAYVTGDGPTIYRISFYHSLGARSYCVLTESTSSPTELSRV